MYTVLLADPAPALRAAFSLLLRRRLAVTAIEEAADLERLDQALASAAPDLLLLDWRLLEADQPALRRWQQRQPTLKIVVMSVDAEDAAPAIAAGANGFIYKGAPPAQAIASLRRCLAQPGENGSTGAGA